MKTIYYLSLFFFAAFMLLAMFSFIETTGNLFYGGAVILLLILQTIFGGIILGKSAHNEELVKTYREAEKLYKDVIDIEKKHNKELDEITENIIETNTRVNNDQISLNGTIKDHLAFTRTLLKEEHETSQFTLKSLESIMRALAFRKNPAVRGTITQRKRM